MDIRMFLNPLLTAAELERRGGTYTGVIAAVTVEKVNYNPKTKKHSAASEQQVPVVQFNDGTRAIPNKAMMRTLAAVYGDETDGWVGRRVTIFGRKVDRVDKATGELRSRFERAVMADAPVAAPSPADDEYAMQERVSPLDDSEIPFDTSFNYGANRRR